MRISKRDAFTRNSVQQCIKIFPNFSPLPALYVTAIPFVFFARDISTVLSIVQPSLDEKKAISFTVYTVFRPFFLSCAVKSSADFSAFSL